MAAEYIEIKHKNKDGKEKTIKYRIDADFIPKKLGDICEEFIQNYCLDKGETDWLDKQYDSTEVFEVKSDKGKKFDGVKYVKGDKYTAPKSFISIRKDFAEKFFDIKKKEEKTKTGRDKWAEKKKKAKK